MKEEAVMKTILFTLTAAVLTVWLGGCSNHYYEQYEQSDSNLGMRRETEDRTENNRRSYGFQINDTRHHNNARFRFSPEAARKVRQIQGIAHSYVLITDKNAYVAIVTDNTATGSASKGKARDLNNVGTTQGMDNPDGGTSYADPRKLADENNGFYTMKKPQDISSMLQEKVARAVRGVHPEVLEVFISANRDFVNRLNSYAIKTRQGQTLDPYRDELNALVRKQFPEPNPAAQTDR
jgi:YhcN/YlaJ family sporulation lipoprotein